MQPFPSLRYYIEQYGIVRGHYEWFLDICEWFIELPILVVMPPLRIFAGIALAVLTWSIVGFVVSTLLFILW